MVKRKKPLNAELVAYRLDEQSQILSKIDSSVQNLRKDVLEQAIPAIDKKVENLKGKTTVWAAIISLLMGGGVSIVIAMIL